MAADLARPLTILQVHNRYRHPGGEDTVVANEANLLRAQGHRVELFEVFNDSSDPASFQDKLRLARDTVWSPAGIAAISGALDRFSPDVVHVHNTFSKLSPAILRTVAKRRIAVVQTLHNYRLTCANGLLLRANRPCELCVDGGRYHALVHKCYRHSVAGSAVVSLSGQLHLMLGTYEARGMRVIALTEFARKIFLRVGLGSGVLRVKPNFVFPDPPQSGQEARSPSVVFVGRMEEEKGIDVLLDAWQRAALPGWTLDMVGEGSLRPAATERDPSVRWSGWLSPSEVMLKIRAARFLIMASRWYEGLPMVLLEALSAATPIIVPRLGGMAELVSEGRTGHAFDAGDPASLAQVLFQAAAQPALAWQAMSAAALQDYEDRFSPEVNYQQLMAIYQEAIAELSS